MKKILMILAAILALGSLTAKAQMRSGVDTLTLDQVKYRITYDAKQVNDTTQIPYIYRKAQMRLDIGSNISLVRDTKQLTISLHQLDEPADIHAEDFSYQITDANGYINYDNTLLPDEELTYTPYKTWTTEFTTPEGTVQERTAHAALMFSRLVLHPVTENNKNAVLSIWNKKTGEEVVRINLADFLAQGRGAFEALNYSAQEFLDREYDYKLDFFLKGDKWQYVKLGISILDWSKRIQRADL